ncbi:MAG: type IX secretion system membrane protein PorP/SprF [Bacteroidota bacterium]
MRKLKYILPVFLGLLFFRAQAQQDPVIGQYQFNQMMFNPAYAGAGEVTSFDLQVRKQWLGLDGSPTTALLSGNSSLYNKYMAAGFTLVYDEVGINQNTDFFGAYSYAINFSETVKLSFGLQAGFTSFNYNYSKLNLDDVTDADFTEAPSGFVRPNFGTGFFLAGPKFYLGLSVPRMLDSSDKNGNEVYRKHYYVSGGFILEPFIDLKIKPYFLLRYINPESNSIEIGSNFLLSQVVWVGVNTRNLNTVGMMFTVLFSNIRAGYSGEFLSDGLAPSIYSTHEIYVGVDLAFFNNTLKQIRLY